LCQTLVITADTSLDEEPARLPDHGSNGGNVSIFKTVFTLVVTLTISAICLGQSEKPLLLRSPSVSRTHVAFSYGCDIWIVSREGGAARRLTASIGIETHLVFSPDGSQVAFPGEYDGNQDVYVVATGGGVPRRLTYHPGPDEVAGWTPDGKRIMFRSLRSSYTFGASNSSQFQLGGGPKRDPCREGLRRFVFG